MGHPGQLNKPAAKRQRRGGFRLAAGLAVAAVLGVLLQPALPAPDLAAEHGDAPPGHHWEKSDVHSTELFLHSMMWECFGERVFFWFFFLELGCKAPPGEIGDKMGTGCSSSSLEVARVCRSAMLGSRWRLQKTETRLLDVYHYCSFTQEYVSSPGHCGRWVSSCVVGAPAPGSNHRHTTEASHLECAVHDVPECADDGWWRAGPEHQRIRVSKCDTGPDPGTETGPGGAPGGEECADAGVSSPPGVLHRHPGDDPGHGRCKRHTPPQCALSGMWTAHSGHRSVPIQSCTSRHHPCGTVSAEQIAETTWDSVTPAGARRGASVSGGGPVRPGSARTITVSGPTADPLSSNTFRPKSTIPIFGSLVLTVECGSVSYAPVVARWALVPGSDKGTGRLTVSDNNGATLLDSTDPAAMTYECAYDGTDTSWARCLNDATVTCDQGPACGEFAFHVSIIWRITVTPDTEVNYQAANSCTNENAIEGRFIECRTTRNSATITKPLPTMPGF